MTPLNDHNHKLQQPWQVLGHIRDDLKQARAHLRRRSPRFRTNDDARALIAIERALSRVGDGTREGDAT